MSRVERCDFYMVEIRVKDLERSCQWYQDIVGMREVMRDPKERFVLLGPAGQKGGTRLALKEADPSSFARESLMLAFEVQDVPGWLDRLRQQGIESESGLKISDEGYQRIKLRDPDGYAVQLFEWVSL
jgi:catechol 2,3-dioxygenase-like lactoylglutathione lyase family enzyme